MSPPGAALRTATGKATASPYAAINKVAAVNAPNNFCIDFPPLRFRYNTDRPKVETQVRETSVSCREKAALEPSNRQLRASNHSVYYVSPLKGLYISRQVCA
jgi:hypothetical protein